jgi:hypothetical protein
MVAKQETRTEVIVGAGGLFPQPEDDPPPQLVATQAARSAKLK